MTQRHVRDIFGAKWYEQRSPTLKHKGRRLEEFKLHKNVKRDYLDGQFLYYLYFSKVSRK